MKHLYKAESNAMTFYIVEDFKMDQAIIVDWDLSDEEENELIAAFENGTLDYTANGCEWEDCESSYAGLFYRKCLA